MYESDDIDSAGDVAAMSRRKMMLMSLSTISMTMGLSATSAHATTEDSATTRTRTGPLDGNLAELPSEAVRSYLQYRGPLQTSADFYVFDLQELLTNVNEWGLVGELFQTSNARGGQGSPNRMERDFVNTMRIISLSMPPSDEADDMITASLQFAGAMQKISKATAGIRRDLPVEIDVQAVPDALRGWEDGRVAFNSFLLALNRGMDIDEWIDDATQIEGSLASSSCWGARHYFCAKATFFLFLTHHLLSVSFFFCFPPPLPAFLSLYYIPTSISHWPG
jgi:hypothetical protein